MQERKTKIAIYGGNGFVGTRVAQQLVERDACTVCLSRTGHKPLHLKDKTWSKSVRWCKGDASEPDAKLLESIDVLVCLVGSPPIPTLTKEGFEKQVFMNGVTNTNAIKAAADAGIRRLVLLGAKIPWPLNTDSFGYAKGKRMSLQAAEEFSMQSDEHRATVIQPGVIYGKRHLSSGRVVPLDWVMGPLAKLMPWQFSSVDQVAKRIVGAALNDSPDADRFSVIAGSDI